MTGDGNGSSAQLAAHSHPHLSPTHQHLSHHTHTQHALPASSGYLQNSQKVSFTVIFHSRFGSELTFEKLWQGLSTTHPHTHMYYFNPQKCQKVSFRIIFYSKFSSKLTFENFWQGLFITHPSRTHHIPITHPCITPHPVSKFSKVSSLPNFSIENDCKADVLRILWIPCWQGLSITQSITLSITHSSYTHASLHTLRFRR